jgi:hypothetical protein
MSEQQPARASGPSPGRNPWVTALLILIGLILLLPGLCSVILTGILISAGGPGGADSEYLPLLLMCFLIGVGGVALIIFAVRRR